MSKLKFTIECDWSQGLFGKHWTERLSVFGRNEWDTVEDVSGAFYALDMFDKWDALKNKEDTAYFVQAYVWKTDEDGNITTEDGWDELSDDDKNRMSDLTFAYCQNETEEEHE